ncbi:hypothetical protein B0H19DRAFT_1117740 [Mycena capillaripes]|nr:hypothetical protein B0H19DRAFT_1117740 [Mycena capillaripes]
MKPKNIRLRSRLSDIESQLLQIECPTNRRVSDRLKPERQHQLMKEKISIQESLNLIVYAILTLPVEVTSEIFLHCLPTEPDQPSTSVAPMVLGRICQQWRNIAYNNPRLWAAMKIRFRRNAHHGFGTLVRDWLLRAGSMPLALRLILPYRPWGLVPKPCYCPTSCLFTDSWTRLTSFHGDNFTPMECFQLLTHATRLVRCEFRTVLHGPTSFVSPTPLILPGLTYLGFTYIPSASRVFRILDLLALPELRSLSFIGVLYFCDEYASLCSFLKRTPSIRSFLYNHQYPSEFGDFKPILDAMPDLTSLSITSDNTDAIFEIIEQLGEPTRTSLPHIQTVAFFTTQRFVWKNDYTPTLVDTLVSRWDAIPGVARLLDFELSFLLTDGAEVDKKIAECVSELKRKGMCIYVGAPLVS